jgi:hypothetical protein
MTGTAEYVRIRCVLYAECSVVCSTECTVHHGAFPRTIVTDRSMYMRALGCATILDLYKRLVEKRVDDRSWAYTALLFELHRDTGYLRLVAQLHGYVRRPQQIQVEAVLQWYRRWLGLGRN